MKALTLHQPYASAIALGLKHFETRAWKTTYRGPVAIHAAQCVPKYAKDLVAPIFVRGKQGLWDWPDDSTPFEFEAA